MPRSNYALRTNGLEHGTVYTNPVLVNFMLDSVGYVASRDLSKLSILEPAAGNGAFLLAIVDRLYASSQRFGFSFEKALQNVTTYELDRQVAMRLRSALQVYCLNKGYQILDKQLHEIVICQDFLLPAVLEAERSYDIIVGNPPYIRHEQIPEKQRLSYRRYFSTFRHRSDIYIAFYEKSLKQLNAGGSLCFICSNRWMKTKYGEALRSLVTANYSIDAIIDIEDRAAFDQDVDAYASVTLLSSKKNTSDSFYYRHIDDLNSLRPINVGNKANTHLMKRPINSNWHIGEVRSFEFHDSYMSIEQQGYKIGIGVASGADKVFIDKSLPIEDDLKLPIITAREINNGEIDWSGQYILNPYTSAGALIDLDAYPLAKQYLNMNSAVLKNRHTARKSRNDQWYKTIDRIYPELTLKPKLLIPDMKRDGLFPIDEGKLYPHHNIYYITHESIDNLKILGAFLMSDFCKEQIRLASVTMRGGFARWQSQNLRKLLLPNLKTLNKNTRLQLIDAYDAKNVEFLNKLISKQMANA